MLISYITNSISLKAPRILKSWCFFAYKQIFLTLFARIYKLRNVGVTFIILIINVCITVKM